MTINSKTKPKLISVTGIPFDDNSSFMFGTAQAPTPIREALHSHSSNLTAENGIDLGESEQWHDLGDLDIDDDYTAFKEIQDHISKIISTESKVVSIGGDHSITFPIVKAHADAYFDLNILHLDAHPDLYDSLDGNRHSHASPFARIMEKGLVKRLVQVGIRTSNPHQREQADKFGVEVFEMKDGIPSDLEFDGPVYLSVDMDCLDPAFAPGVAHYEPGGMSTREVINLIHQFKGQIVGADIVEYNPARDVNGITAMVAAKFLKEIVARMLASL